MADTATDAAAMPAALQPGAPRLNTMHQGAQAHPDLEPACAPSRQHRLARSYRMSP
jgi:hypothetical protein